MIFFLICLSTYGRQCTYTTDLIKFGANKTIQFRKFLSLLQKFNHPNTFKRCYKPEVIYVGATHLTQIQIAKN